ncbi:MAG: MFS transporter [Gemmatimonadota bacterium]|nr:MFS transporter [Gemmatimonadota bacterium]
MTAAGPRSVHGLLARVVDVRPEETRAMLMAFAYFFFVLSGYFILRPIRDEVAVTSGVARLPGLWTGTLAAMLVCNPFYSALTVRFPVRKFIPITYHFFVANLLAFYVVMRVVAPAEGSPADLWTGRVFYVWTSVFNLFVVSVFWCFMADVFRSGQGKRLFGFIGVGGTLGAIVGSGLTALMASRIGTKNLLLVSAALLELAVLMVVLYPVGGAGEATAVGVDQLDRTPIGGSVWAGFRRVATSPYLAGIAAFLILYTVGNTFLYAEQTDIVGRFFVGRTAQTGVLARIDFFAQTLTVLIEMFLTGRVIRWIGLTATLAFLPVLTVAGFGALGTVPVFATLALFIVLRRASNYALTNPAMEVLFTVVPREDKYKAKAFIETFVYRGGDQVAVWTYAGLTAIGLSLAGIAFAAMPLAAVWLMLAVWLGRKQAELAGEPAGAAIPVTVAGAP